MPKPIADAPGLDFAWERGYFRDSPDDRQSVEWNGKWRKNVDFIRLKDKALHIVGPRSGLKVLELGCGAGAHLVYCGLLGAEVHGIDVNSDSITLANAKLQHFGISGNAQVGDIRKLDYDEDVFDVVLSSDCHEHLTESVQVETLREALRVLKPGAYLVLKTPNLSYLKTALVYKRVGAILRGTNPRDYVIPHASETGPDAHVGLTTRWQLGNQLADAGFLNWEFLYAPLRRYGRRPLVELLSTEMPFLRDVLSEDLFLKAYKPIILSYFPD